MARLRGAQWLLLGAAEFLGRCLSRLARGSSGVGNGGACEQAQLLLLGATFVCTLLGLGTLAGGATTFQVHRLLQADLDGVAVGSPFINFKSFATLPLPGATLFRAVVLVPLEMASVELLEEGLREKSGTGAYLILLPDGFDSGELTSLEHKNLQELQQMLISATYWNIPLYFAAARDLKGVVAAVRSLAAKGKFPTKASHPFEVAVQGRKRPEVLRGGGGANYIAWLPAEEGQLIGQSRGPTLAVVASYDAFCIAPSIACGGNANASGATAALALLRFFHRLYTGLHARGRYNLLFALTSGGPLGFEGTRQWLGDSHPALVESIALALCLDTLGSAHAGQPPVLYAHAEGGAASRGVEQDVLTFLEAASRDAGVGFEIRRLDGDTRRESDQVGWEHMVFAQRQVPALTLSAQPEPLPAFLRRLWSVVMRSVISWSILGWIIFYRMHAIIVSRTIARFVEATRSRSHTEDLDSMVDQDTRSGLQDGYKTVDPVGLMQLTGLIKAAMSHVLYRNVSYELLSTLDSNSGVELAFATHWLEAFGSTPRMIPYLTTDGALGDALSHAMSIYGEQQLQHKWQLDGRHTFYNVTSVAAELYATVGVLHETILTLVVLAYLGLLYSTLQIATKGWADFVRIFQSEHLERRSRQKTYS